MSKDDLIERLRASKAVVNLLAAGEATAPNLSAFAVCDNLDEAADVLESILLGDGGDRSAQSQPGCVPSATTSDAEPSGAGWYIKDFGHEQELDEVFAQYCVAESNYVPVAYVFDPSYARLIAAVPDMYEALRALMAASSEEQEFFAYQSGRAALSKAEGRA